ncbi:MAG: SRPBCC family protein [Acidimicrobiia bacterium]
MQITDQFRVDVPVEQAWKVFLDVERIAPCMPGAQLQEIEGDEYRGIVKVKVGPISAQYKGAARIVEADEATHRIVIRAEGRDTRGQGNAAASVTATLTADGNGTSVAIDTDLHVTGKVAQFGRGVMADVSSKLLGQFVECLHSKVLAEDALDEVTQEAIAVATAAELPATPIPPMSGVRTVDAPEAQAVDLGRVAGGAVAKRLVPVLVAGIIVIGVVVWLVTR